MTVMGSTHSIIITAADESFASLLIDWLDSMQQWDTPVADALGLINLGLSEETLAKVSERFIRVVEPGWDLPIMRSLREQQPQLRALTVRPFLPDYFPGFEVYLWIDSDAWVQERFAIDHLIDTAGRGVMGIVAENHPSYADHQPLKQWRSQRMQEYFGASAAQSMTDRPYLNAGVFSLAQEAPHWKAWQSTFEQGLIANPDLVCDQTALNYMLGEQKLPVRVLSPLYNWCCHLAIPKVSLSLPGQIKLTEPSSPYRSLGIVHLTWKTKDLKVELSAQQVQGNLRYRGLSMDDQPN